MSNSKLNSSNLHKELSYLIKDMIIPSFRKELDKNNLLWLKKNLGKKNSAHKNYGSAMNIINILLENKLYTH